MVGYSELGHKFLFVTKSWTIVALRPKLGLARSWPGRIQGVKGEPGGFPRRRAKNNLFRQQLAKTRKSFNSATRDPDFTTRFWHVRLLPFSREHSSCSVGDSATIRSGGFAS